MDGMEPTVTVMHCVQCHAGRRFTLLFAKNFARKKVKFLPQQGEKLRM